MNSSENFSSTDSDSVDFNNFGFPRSARFALYLIFDTPALLCSIFILYYLVCDRACRQALHNHSIGALLVVAFIMQLLDIPIYMDQLRGGTTWSKPSAFCIVWHYIDSSGFAATPVLLAWSSMERHLLVFHSTWLRSRRNKVLLHYLPLVLLIVYIYTFYFIVVIFPPCTNTFDANCGGLCFFNVPWLSLWDLVGHNIFPSVLIVISSGGLLVRTIWQKRNMHQPVEWRRFRKMTLQLLFISSLFLIFCLPATICFALLPFGYNTDALFAALPYVAYFSFFPQLLLPFVCLVSLPELWPKLRRLSNIRLRVVIVAPLPNGMPGTNTTPHPTTRRQAWT